MTCMSRSTHIIQPHLVMTRNTLQVQTDTTNDDEDASWNSSQDDPHGFYESSTSSSDSLPIPRHAFHVAAISVELLSQAQKIDPSVNAVGQPLNLCNWLLDSGASSHMTPHLADLVHVEEELNLGVEVADRHIVKCTTRDCVTIDMTVDDGFPLQEQLYDVIYTPSLKQRSFSVTAFMNQGHSAVL